MTDDQYRSHLLAGILRERKDEAQRELIDKYAKELDFSRLNELMISVEAWRHVQSLAEHPQVVFAHPDILSAHPTTSLHYRGITLLSRKRVQQASGVAVTDWETGTRKPPIPQAKTKKIARLYNTIISTIIEGSADWTLDNGYRNILATTGITLDGMFRNKIGEIAETLIKHRLVKWLSQNDLVTSDSSEETSYTLPNDTLMRFGSEPDVEFARNKKLIATVEIKGGRDPAGALERLGAVEKSFTETPPTCVNFLIAGVITPEMQTRLNKIGTIKVYLLDEISKDGPQWDEFTNELFHHAVRVI